MALTPKQMSSMNKSKNQRNNPYKQRPKVSYFDRQESQYGALWLNQKEPRNMMNEIKQVIRDLAKQNIDIPKHAHYFGENMILNFAINEVDNQLIKYTTIYNALSYYTYNMGLQNVKIENNVILTMEQYKNLMILYTALSNCFHTIRVNGELHGNLERLYYFLNNCSAKHYMEDEDISKDVFEKEGDYYDYTGY